MEDNKAPSLDGIPNATLKLAVKSRPDIHICRVVLSMSGGLDLSRGMEALKTNVFAKS